MVEELQQESRQRRDPERGGECHGERFERARTAQHGVEQYGQRHADRDNEYEAVGAFAEASARAAQTDAVLQAAQAAGGNPQRQRRERCVAPQTGAIGQAQVESGDDGRNARQQNSGAFQRHARFGIAGGKCREIRKTQQYHADDQASGCQPQ